MKTCQHKSIARMDYTQQCLWGTTPSTPMVNRMCLHCHTHWFGESVANVVEIPARIWDAWMNTALISELN